MCAGSSFGTHKYEGTDVTSRGAAVLEAVVEHLMSTTAISNAKELVLYGKDSKCVYTSRYLVYSSTIGSVVKL